MVVLNVNAIINSGNLKPYLKPYITAWYSIHVMKVSKPTSYDNEYGEGHYDLSVGDAILEGTRSEHRSPEWRKIALKYLLEDGSKINPDELPYDVWILIQTNPDREERKKSVVWMIPATLISKVPFKVGSLVINPEVDFLCIGGDAAGPNPDWGAWPVKKDIFGDTYEALI